MQLPLSTLKKAIELVHKNSNLEWDVVSLNKKVSDLTTEIAGIDQYLRVNNVEIIDLPEPLNGETVEEQAIEIFNELCTQNGNAEISKQDIDICHPLPSNRKDNKRVVICRFISRNTKAMIILAKRVNQMYKYRDHEIFIKDHMSENK